MNGVISFVIGSVSGYYFWFYIVFCLFMVLMVVGNIFGVYYDIDFLVVGLVKWYLLGSVFCWIFVVVFNGFVYYFIFCNNLRIIFMMVLYEMINVIDVYVF